MIPPEYTGVVLFTATWSAESCSSARQILQTSCTRSKVDLLELEESEANESVFDALGVEAVPCAVKMVKGVVVSRVYGASSKELLALSAESVSAKSAKSASVSVSVSTKTESTPPSTTATPTIPPSTPGDLELLVNRSKLMLFIKGTPSAPQCGFTGQLIRLLSQHGLTPDRHYSTFNILSDQVLREELKKWAQWPTYPQVYWKGELVGGLDILKEMFANNQMDEIISELME